MSDEVRFSEERVTESFKSIRNRLRKSYPEEVILACIRKLNQHPPDPIQFWRKYPPWKLLLIIKWTFIHGEYLSPDRRVLSGRDFNYILYLMGELEKRIRMPNQYENVFLLFRNMAFQQFWLQHELRLSTFSRQSVLFGKLDTTHPFHIKFFEKFAISVPQFIELALMLMTCFIVEKKHFVTRDWFKPVENNYPIGTIERFLELLSGDIDSIRDLLLKLNQPGRKISYEIYEKTPLRERPLFRHDAKYYPFSPELLARSIESFIYDKLRNDDPESFMEKFGPIFEKYVGDSISKMGVPFICEKHLREMLPGNGKLVDYLMIDAGTKVFIDAKGVEMAYLGMVGHQPEIVKDKTKNSVTKGIQQGFDTAKRLDAIGKVGDITVDYWKENYLIIVTFKDLFLGNGSDFYTYIAKNALDKLTQQYDETAPIPFDHMYFMCIDDFDLLAEVVASGRASLSDILRFAVVSDAVGQTKKLTFRQHIMDLFPKAQEPKWLLAESHHILDECSLKFIQ